MYEIGENHPTVRYTHPLVCDGGVCGPTAYMFVDAPISIVVNGVKYYYLYDALGSVTELIDENENVVNRYRYTPFGESFYKVEGVFNPYQYTGRRYDQETGQYYYRARMYSPVQGRFLSQDPMGMIDGPNMYAYARNNPVNYRDPSGRWPPFWGPPMLINGGAPRGGRYSWPTPPGVYRITAFGVRIGWKFVTTRTLTDQICYWVGTLGFGAASLIAYIKAAASYAALLKSGVGPVIIAYSILTCTCSYFNGRMVYHWYDKAGGGGTSYCEW